MSRREGSSSNLLVEVVVRKSRISLRFKETGRRADAKPPSYYASMIYFGDVLRSAGKVAEAVIPAEEKERFEREFYQTLEVVRKALGGRKDERIQVSDSA